MLIGIQRFGNVTFCFKVQSTQHSDSCPQNAGIISFKIFCYFSKSLEGCQDASGCLECQPVPGGLLKYPSANAAIWATWRVHWGCDGGGGDGNCLAAIAVQKGGSLLPGKKQRQPSPAMGIDKANRANLSHIVGHSR